MNVLKKVDDRVSLYTTFDYLVALSENRKLIIKRQSLMAEMRIKKTGFKSICKYLSHKKIKKSNIKFTDAHWVSKLKRRVFSSLKRAKELNASTLTQI